MACLDLKIHLDMDEIIDRLKSEGWRPIKKGKWVGYPECLKYINAYADDHIVCSNCEECFSILENDCERFNYCPNCGAKMDGGDN